MKLLLDTHTFLWFGENSKHLPTKTRKMMEDSSHTLHLSIASLWEIAIKMSLGKLKTKQPLAKTIQQTKDQGIHILAVTPEHTLLISKLPFHHRDPFDRMIIAQALEEQMTIVGKDELFELYGVKRVW